MLQEGLWTRFFPAVEHARKLLASGTIGDVVMARADFPDRCYAVQLSPLAFGPNAVPTNVVGSSRSVDGGSSQRLPPPGLKRRGGKGRGRKSDFGPKSSRKAGRRGRRSPPVDSSNLRLGYRHPVLGELLEPKWLRLCRLVRVPQKSLTPTRFPMTQVHQRRSQKTKPPGAPRRLRYDHVLQEY